MKKNMTSNKNTRARQSISASLVMAIVFSCLTGFSGFAKNGINTMMQIQNVINETTVGAGAYTVNESGQLVPFSYVKSMEDNSGDSCTLEETKTNIMKDVVVNSAIADFEENIENIEDKIKLAKS